MYICIEGNNRTVEGEIPTLIYRIVDSRMVCTKIAMAYVQTVVKRFFVFSFCFFLFSTCSQGGRLLITTSHLGYFKE